MKKGFTLVELSIVLVIIGLLIGGILVGQSLIDSVKIRIIISTYQQHVSAIELFNDKFRCLPGDCNIGFSQGGNNSGSIGEDFTAAHISRENEKLWLQLYEGGFLAIPYSGNNGQSGADRVIAGKNVPIVESADDISDEALLDFVDHFDPDTNINPNWMRFEIGTETNGFGGARGRVFFPNTALAIDLKLDDSSPDTGYIIVDGAQNGCGRGTGAYDIEATNGCALYLHHELGEYDFLN